MTFLVLFLAANYLSANNIDSLDFKFNSATTDEKITLLFEKLPELEREYPDSIFYYIQALEEVGVKEEREDVLAYTNYYFGIYLSDKSLLDEAEIKLNQARSFFDYTENDSILSELSNVEGTIHFRRGDLMKAEEQFLLSMDYGKKSNKPRFKYLAYANLARVYIIQEEFDKAEELIEEYIQFNKEDDFVKKVASGYSLLGQLYMDQGTINMQKNGNEDIIDQQMIDKAVINFEKSLELFLADGSPLQVANGYTNIAISCYFKESPDKALNYFQLALRYRLKSENDFHIAESYHNLGDFYYGTNQYDSALVNYQKAVDVGLASDNKLAVSDAYKQMAEVYGKTQEFQKQTDVLKTYIDIRESILKERSSKELAILRMSYESDKEQLKLAGHQREEILRERVSDIETVWKNWVWILSGCILLAVVLLTCRRLRVKEA